LTWHAQLNCQRALSPADGGVPQLGKVGKLALEASLVCLAGLSSTYSVGCLACRAIFNSTQALGTCQGLLRRFFASTFLANASTSPTGYAMFLFARPLQAAGFSSRETTERSQSRGCEDALPAAPSIRVQRRTCKIQSACIRVRRRGQPPHQLHLFPVSLPQQQIPSTGIAATAEHLPVSPRVGRDLRYRQGFAVELGRCREPGESR
jgi:hypothetical protein